MRIERTGKVEALTPRVERFLVEAMGGKSHDEIQEPTDRRIDYSCLNGLLAVEIKTLETDPNERLNNLAEDLSKRSDWTEFLFGAPVESVISRLQDPGGVRKQFNNRVGRAIINHLKKANKQFEAHVANYPRKNIVRVVLLINEDHELYDPRTVVFNAGNFLAREEDGKRLCDNIDAVIYFSERHMANQGDYLAFPVVEIHSSSLEDDYWKKYLTRELLKRWAGWNNLPFVQGSEDIEFSSINHVPDKASRSDWWRIDYMRNPYMSSWTDEMVVQKLDEIVVINTLAFIKDSPFKPPSEQIIESMEHFTHVGIELGSRAMPTTEFAQTRERALSASIRLNVPKYARRWLSRLLRESLK